MKTTWTVSNIEGANYLGTLGGDTEQAADLELLETPTRIVFGGACNAGFLESGYIEREEGESLEDTLDELLSDLSFYYNEGPQSVSRIVCNDRM